MGSELKTLNTAYKGLKETGEQYMNDYDNSYEIGQVAPLLGSAKRAQTWDNKLEIKFTFTFEVNIFYRKDGLNVLM